MVFVSVTLVVTASVANNPKAAVSVAATLMLAASVAANQQAAVSVAQHPWMVGVTVITWLTLLPRMMTMFSLSCLPRPSSSVAEYGKGAEPLNDDEGCNSHPVPPASAVEGVVVVTGGDGDGDQVLTLIPVSSTPAVIGVAKSYDSQIEELN